MKRISIFKHTMSREGRAYTQKIMEQAIDEDGMFKPLPAGEIQDMEVFAISEVCHVDLRDEYRRRLNSCSERLMQCGSMSAVKVFKEPGSGKNAVWVLKPFLQPDPYDKFMIYSIDIFQIFFCRQNNLVGFIFDYNENEETNSSLVMKLVSDADPGTGYIGELTNFLKFCFKMRPDLQPLDLLNRSYIKKFLTAPMNNLFKAEEIFAKIFQENPKSEPQTVGESMRPYFRPYVCFMLKHHHLGKKAIKKYISSVTNMPEFLKSLSWTKVDMILTTLVMFLQNHACHNPECDGFSLLRCGGCEYVAYCNVECQEKSAKSHDCEASQRSRYNDDFLPGWVEHELRICLGKEPSISVYSFSKSLMTRIYRSFYGALQNKNLLFYVKGLLSSIGWRNKSSDKMMKLLKKGRSTQSLFTLRTQLEQTYGPNNIVVEMMKQW